MNIGRGLVHVCDRCGFIGLYKPEVNPDVRTCPGCGSREQYKSNGDIALIQVEEPS